MNVDFATKEDFEELKEVILNAIVCIGKSKASKSDVFTAKEAADYVKMSVYMLRIKAASGEIEVQVVPHGKRLCRAPAEASRGEQKGLVQCGRLTGPKSEHPATSG